MTSVRPRISMRTIPTEIVPEILDNAGATSGSVLPEKDKGEKT